MSEITVVCGLGNPGPRYRKTRHNLGYMTLDRLASRRALKWKRAPGPTMEAPMRVSGRTVILVKPLSYMNESGVALVRHGEAAAEGLLVVCDDLSLPMGQLRFRMGGGSGGHKGLASIIAELGTERFARLRIGIGSAPPEEEWVEYVLSDFAEPEKDALEETVAKAADAVEEALHAGLPAAMTRYNRSGPPPTSP